MSSTRPPKIYCYFFIQLSSSIHIMLLPLQSSLLHTLPYSLYAHLYSFLHYASGKIWWLHLCPIFTYHSHSVPVFNLHLKIHFTHNYSICLSFREIESEKERGREGEWERGAGREREIVPLLLSKVKKLDFFKTFLIQETI